MIGVKLKGVRFDDASLLKKVDRATLKILRKFGQFVRQTARQSIRRSKTPSQPGRPPHTETGFLKSNLWYTLEPETKNVVIGPPRLKPGGEEVLSALEHGGEVTAYEFRFHGSDVWHEENRNYSRDPETREYRTRQVTIAARPFMRPAFDKEIQELPELWRNSII